MASVRKHALYPTNAQQGKSSARGGRHR
jgi:hypothetical protein